MRKCQFDSMAATGKADHVDWEDQLIDSHFFCSDKPGQIDPVIKSKQPGEKSCTGENQGACNKWMGIFLFFLS